MNVIYALGAVGVPRQFEKGTALGIIDEIAAAGVAQEWKQAMYDYINTQNGIHPDVLEFSEMGTLSQLPETEVRVSVPEEKELITKRLNEYGPKDGTIMRYPKTESYSPAT